MSANAKRRYKEAKAKRERGGFFALPHAVLKSAAYLGLSPFARSLLNDLGLQYLGDNNGDLSVCWKFMKPRGWRSQTTLHKAKKELLDSGLLFETRKGERPNKASLFAFTFYALDPCDGKLDFAARVFPYGAWKLKDPAPPIAKRLGINGERLTPPHGVGDTSIAPPHGVGH